MLKAGAGGVVLGGLVAGAGSRAAAAPSDARETRILNFMLLLEYVHAGFYERAVSGGVLRGELLEFARIVGEHERAHVSALREKLGGAARSEPRLDFGTATGDANEFAETAVELEEGALGVYIGQGGNLTKRSITTVATITSAEARQAAWIRDFLGRPPAPKAADPARSWRQVLADLRRKGFVS